MLTCKAVLAVVFAATCAVAENHGKEAKQAACMRRPTFPGKYGHEAIHNLTEYRTNLVERSAALELAPLVGSRRLLQDAAEDEALWLTDMAIEDELVLQWERDIHGDGPLGLLRQAEEAAAEAAAPPPSPETTSAKEPEQQQPALRVEAKQGEAEEKPELLPDDAAAEEEAGDQGGHPKGPSEGEDPIQWAFANSRGKTDEAAPLEALGTYVEPLDSRWNFMNPFLTCPPEGGANGPHGQLQRIGRAGDGGKWLCPLDWVRDEPECVVYSLGSSGDYTFEASMLKHTPCHVHTFECTHGGISLDRKRHTYHQVCLGRAPKGMATLRIFERFQTITERLGHPKIHIMKIDIEGWEHGLLMDWHKKDTFLPAVLLMEFHFFVADANNPTDPGARHPVSSMVMSASMMHLARLGYGTVAKEIDILAPDVEAEFTFLRVEDLQCRDRRTGDHGHAGMRD